MARTKQTARKMTGPKGVPRHQLAPRDGEASSSRRPRRSRKELKEEIEQLKAERSRLIADLAKARQEYQPVAETVEHLRHNIVQLIKQRDATWARENATRARLHELEQYVEQIEGYNDALHEEVHRLNNQLNPILVPRQEDPELGMVVGPEEEEDDTDEEIEPMEDVHEEDGNDSDVVVIDDD